MLHCDNSVIIAQLPKEMESRQMYQANSESQLSVKIHPGKHRKRAFAFQDILKHASIEDHHPGDLSTGGFRVVLTGIIASVRYLSDGRRVINHIYCDGDIIESVTSDRAAQDELVCLDTATIANFGNVSRGADFLNVPKIKRAIESHAAQKMERMRDHISDLVNKTPLEKVASVIFEFARCTCNSDSDHELNNVKIPLKNSDLGDYLGLRAETVSRSFRHLETEQVISRQQKRQQKIQILDRPALRQIANGGRPRLSNKTGV